MTRNEKDRYENLKAMHTIVQSLNNENAYYTYWIENFPDCPQEDDFEFMSEEEEKDLYKETVECFLYLMKRFAKDGLYIGGDLYSIEE